MTHDPEMPPTENRSAAPRTALVTGGTSGIGLACARRLQADGLRVAVLDLERPQAREVAAEHGLSFVGADLSRRSDTVQAVAAAVAALGGLDVLVNNAGFQHIDPIASFPEDTWDAMLHVMLTAPFLLTKHAWPHLIRSGQGRVVNIASIHARVASPFKSAYVSAKHGLIGLTRTAALEGAEHGLTVNAVCPGLCPDAIGRAPDRRPGPHARHQRVGRGRQRHAGKRGHQALAGSR